MCEAFQITAAERADQVALRTIRRRRRDHLRASTPSGCERLAGGLHALGVRPRRHGRLHAHQPARVPPARHGRDAPRGDAVLDLQHVLAEQIAYLLGDAANRVMVVEAAFLERARRRSREAGIGRASRRARRRRATDAISLEELEALRPGRRSSTSTRPGGRSQPDDVLTLIYTSGTTGPPKGVQLTHANELASAARSTRRRSGAATAARSSRSCRSRTSPTAGLSHYGQMIWGQTITTCPDPAQVFAHVADARPTRFGSVPRMWEKLKAALEAGIAAEPDEARRTAHARRRSSSACGKVRTEQAGEPVPDELRERLRARRGAGLLHDPRPARLRSLRVLHRSVRRPTPLEVFEFFAAIGIPICEVWGMSELSCVATLVPREKIRFGTVGPPLPGRRDHARRRRRGARPRGRSSWPGYRNQPEKTAETIDARRLAAHAATSARFDEDGYLRIVDRKKELIINAAGKNMSPANIEQQLKSGQPADRPGDRDRRQPPLQRGPDRARPRRVGRVRRRATGCPTPRRRRCPGSRRFARRWSAGVERANSQLVARRADQALHDPADRLAAGRRRADADDEAQAQADRREVRGRDRGAVRERPIGPGSPPGLAARGTTATLRDAWHSASTFDFFSSPARGNSAPAAARSREPAPRRSHVRDSQGARVT